MGLESGTLISDLVATNPPFTDKRREGDDHLRLIKGVLKATFPNLNGVWNASIAESNFLVGVTSLIQAQLDARLEKSVAPGTGLVEAVGVLNVQGTLGIQANADDLQIEFSGLTPILGSDLIDTDGFLVDDAGVPKRMSYTDNGLRIIDETTTLRTLVTADMNAYIEADNAAAISIVLDTGVGKKGNVIVIEQFGAGQVTVSGTSTINNANGLKTAKQYSVVCLACKATDVWTLSGDAVV